MLASGLGGVDTLPFRAKIAQFAPCLLLHLPTSTPGQCLRANTFLCFSLQHWEGVSYWSNLCSFTEVQNCYFGFYWQLLPFRRESLSPLNWFYYFTFIRPACLFLLLFALYWECLRLSNARDISWERSTWRGNSTWHKNTSRYNNEDASQGGGTPKWFKETNMNTVDFWAPESVGSLGFLNSALCL